MEKRKIVQIIFCAYNNKIWPKIISVLIPAILTIIQTTYTIYHKDAMFISRPKFIEIFFTDVYIIFVLLKRKCNLNNNFFDYTSIF